MPSAYAIAATRIRPVTRDSSVPIATAALERTSSRSDAMPVVRSGSAVEPAPESCRPARHFSNLVRLCVWLFCSILRRQLVTCLFGTSGRNVWYFTMTLPLVTFVCSVSIPRRGGPER